MAKSILGKCGAANQSRLPTENLPMLRAVWEQVDVDGDNSLARPEVRRPGMPALPLPLPLPLPLLLASSFVVPAAAILSCATSPSSDHLVRFARLRF